MGLICAMSVRAGQRVEGPVGTAVSDAVPTPPSPTASWATLGEGEFVARLHLDEHESVRRAFRKGGGKPTARFSSGALRGAWQFVLDANGVPTRVLRDVDDSGPDGYRAQRIGYCSEEPATCESWFATQRAHAPRPAHEAGPTALIQWRNRVIVEPCQPGPDYRPSLAPLLAAAGRAKKIEHAVVWVELTVNACGEVRDAFVSTTSGSEDFDRTALAWVRRARFVSNRGILASPDASGRAQGLVGRIPITLEK